MTKKSTKSAAALALLAATMAFSVPAAAEAAPAPQPVHAKAIADPYRIPEVIKDTAGPGLKNWYARSKQDGWRGPWRYTKSGAQLDAVEHWGIVTGL